MIRIYKGKEIRLLDEVYDPGEDSFLLVESALAEVKKGERVLEVGTGSGVVSIFLKDIADVVAADISPLACKNARLNGVEVVRADLFRGICGRFDVVIYNPPYLPTSDEEKVEGWLNRAFDGGPDGRREIRRFIKGVKEVLTGHGRLLMAISSLADIDAVMEELIEAGLRPEIVAEQKVCFEKLVVIKAVAVHTF